MSTLSDDEMDAIGDAMSEVWREQNEAEAERLGAWYCPLCKTFPPLGENCSECGEHPSACECEECQEVARSWLCVCGNYETGGCHCGYCGCEPPWGCDCGEHDEYLDEDGWPHECEPEYMGMGEYLPRDESDDEWADEHERDDSEGWDDET